MNESTKENLKHVGTGAMLVAIFGLVAGVAFGVVRNGQSTEPSFDPVAAYCRGISDGQVHALVMNQAALDKAGIPYSEPSDKASNNNEAQCAQAIENSVLPGHLRGPLFMPEDE